MTETVKQPLDYAKVLRVIGQFIQQERLSEVSVLEYQDGWIIHGLTFKSTPQGFVRVSSDFLLSHEDVRNMQARLETQRRDAQKRRWGR